MGRKRPHDPGLLARQTAERKEREAEIARLLAQGATVTADPARRIISARRTNVFTVLLARQTITPNHYDAAYTLANSWAAWKGLDGGPEYTGGKVDGGSGCKEIVTDRMIRAGKDVAWALGMIQQPSRKLLEAFMVATVEEDRPMVWRAIVHKSTGEGVEKKQASLVVAALEALRAGYQDPRQARAA